MSARDIMPWNGNGQIPRVVHYRLDASQTFAEGEPVYLNSTNELQESADEPIPANLTGIALAGPAAARNPATGVAWATGDMVPVCLPEVNTYFITPNFTAAGSAFADTAPAVGIIGDPAGLALISGVWGVDGGPGANAATCRIIDVLNSQKESIQVTGETLTTSDVSYIVFQIVAHQGTPDSAEAAAQGTAA
jgi:hypothetical protein